MALSGADVVVPLRLVPIPVGSLAHVEVFVAELVAVVARLSVALSVAVAARLSVAVTARLSVAVAVPVLVAARLSIAMTRAGPETGDSGASRRRVARPSPVAVVVVAVSDGAQRRDGLGEGGHRTRRRCSERTAAAARAGDVHVTAGRAG